MGDGCSDGAVVVPRARNLQSGLPLPRTKVSRRAGNGLAGAWRAEEASWTEIVPRLSCLRRAEEMLWAQLTILDTLCIRYPTNKSLIKVIALFLTRRIQERTRNTANRLNISSSRAVVTTGALPPISKLQ